MFPDSDIAKSMACAETKSMYFACVGIAPHFQALLEKKVKGDDYVLLFDESLNRELQKIRLIQLLMDGPNVNWAIFDKLVKSPGSRV